MMNEDFIQRLDFDSQTFASMKHDMNFILQRMLGSMIEKDSTEGKMTISIDINMVQEWIPNNDPDIEGETRMIRKPQFKHKCSYAIKVTDEKSGNLNNEMEMDMDENGCYYLKPVADTTQRTIFDKDFQSGLGKPESGTIIDVEEKDIREIPAENYPALPCGESEGEEEQSEDTEQNSPENAPDSSNSGESVSDNISFAENENDAEIDATEALFGNDIGEKEPDDYNYDNPEESDHD